MDAIFDFNAALSARTISDNTRRAYFRWVDRYLVDSGGYKPTRGEARLRRMERLKVLVLKRIINARRLESWLAMLAAENHGRQSLDQARAALVTLAQLLADAHHVEAAGFEQVQAIPVPSVAKNPAPDRLLDSDELKKLINAARDMATAPAAMTRNQVVVTLLCTMALRREEVSALKWGDVTLTEGGKPALRVDNTLLEMPRSLLTLIDRWRGMVKSGSGDPQAVSALVRRIWKGGKIARQGLSPDGIWLIIHDAAQQAGFEAVSPEDLRRSVVAGLRASGVNIQDISRLLRHRSVLVTERFLAKLRQPEE